MKHGRMRRTTRTSKLSHLKPANRAKYVLREVVPALLRQGLLILKRNRPDVFHYL